MAAPAPAAVAANGNPFSRSNSRPTKPVATTLTATARSTLLTLCDPRRMTRDAPMELQKIGIGRQYFKGAYHVPPAPMELDRRLTAMTRKICGTDPPDNDATLTDAQRRLLDRASVALAKQQARLILENENVNQPSSPSPP
jgi:hypothetical protein